MDSRGLSLVIFNLLLVQYPAWLACGWGSSGSVDPDLQASHPAGHLQPLGAHRPPEDPIDSVEKFDPVTPEKFSLYQQGSKPLLFKGAADILPAYHKWTDDYLIEKYGSLKVDVERGKKENRSMGMETIPLSDFLRQYITEDIYMVQDVLQPMKDDLIVPRPIVCGGYTDKLATVVIWFSSGGTRSVFHRDFGLDNINCLLDGRKFLYMVHKKYADKVLQDGWVENGGYSSADVEKVDMHKFPAFQELPWFSVTMEKGDCLYIPEGWFHAVNSTPPRNIAVNLWFPPLKQFQKQDCDKMSPEIPLFLPLQNFKLHHVEDFYKSDPSQTTDDETLRYIIFSDFVSNDPKKPLNIEVFTGVLQGEASNEDIKKAFLEVDTDNDGKISAEEVAKAPVRTLVSKYPWLYPNYVQEPAQTGSDSDAAEPPPPPTANTEDESSVKAEL